MSTENGGQRFETSRCLALEIQIGHMGLMTADWHETLVPGRVFLWHKLDWGLALERRVVAWQEAGNVVEIHETKTHKTSKQNRGIEMYVQSLRSFPLNIRGNTAPKIVR